MRNKIKAKLLEIEPNNDRIFYGMVTDNKNIDEWDRWDYFVFGQQRMRKSGSNKIDLNGYWYVVIVRENFIPDDLVKEVINKMQEINGLRLADSDFEYEYMARGNTNNVCEMLILTFTKSKKGVLLCQ